jgi:hypothetical protein
MLAKWRRPQVHESGDDGLCMIINMLQLKNKKEKNKTMEIKAKVLAH